MTVTKDQALTADAFHYDHEVGGKVYRWRRNGATQTWKRSPERFRVPVKYGLYNYGQITEDDARNFHTEQDCPTVLAESADITV